MCSTKPRANRREGKNAELVLTPERRLEIEQLANRYGSANCWTGTTGTLATAIRELLAEIDNMQMTTQTTTNLSNLTPTKIRWNILGRLTEVDKPNDIARAIKRWSDVEMVWDELYGCWRNVAPVGQVVVIMAYEGKR